jgi:ABC-2 type transport system ATP-binding protein
MVSTHYMDEAEYCTQIGIMRAGKLLALAEPDALKQQLPGRVWEVHAQPLLAAVELLERQPYVHNAALANDHLRVIAEPQVAAAAIAACLQGQGVQVLAIREGAATIEDVFMALASASTPGGAALPA